MELDMTKWTKIPSVHGKPRKKNPSVMRTRTGAQTAFLNVPNDFTGAEYFNVYSDGNGKLAFDFTHAGERLIFRVGGKSHQSRMVIPSSHAAMIPFGTTDAVLTVENGLHVLDTAQFNA